MKIAAFLKGRAGLAFIWAAAHARMSTITMNFSSFFSEQARRPDGLFGRVVMSIVFDKGNAFLNDFVNAGFSKNVNIVSRKKGNLIFHCAIAIK